MNNHISSTIDGNTEWYYKRLYLIYGHKDVVLSTTDKTFLTCSIGLSNTVLVGTPIPDVYASDLADNELVIPESQITGKTSVVLHE